MDQNIPLQNLTKQNAQIREELIADFTQVLDSGRYVSGPGVERFENEFANYVGASFGIGLSTGSAAVELALKAVGIEKGDEVIVPSMTFIASIEAILEADAVPVLIDIVPMLESPLPMYALLTRIKVFVLKLLFCAVNSISSSAGS